MLKMYAIIDAKISGHPLTKDDYISFGGYNFTCNINGKKYDVPFDWNSFIGDLNEDGTLYLEAGGETPFGGDGELDNCFDEEYKELGFERTDLTAEILASSIRINEFTIDYDYPKDGDYINILELCFEDENGIYFIDTDVLNNFNMYDFATNEHPHLDNILTEKHFSPEIDD